MRKFAILALLTAAGLVPLVACSARGGSDSDARDLGRPDAEEDASYHVDDAGLDDASDSDSDSDGADAAPDAERPLVCGDAGFCETRLPLSPLGKPLSLTRVFAVSSNDVWSISSEGTVLHYDGTSWRIEYEAGHVLSALWATPTAVWIGGEEGIILRRDEKGVWTTFDSGHGASIRAIAGTSDSDVWLTSQDASVDHFDGNVLTNYPVNVPGIKITTVFGRAGQGMFAGGYVPGGLVLISYTDKGYVFELSTAGVVPFADTPSRLIPVECAVADLPGESPRILVAGFRRGLKATPAFVTMGKTGNETPVSPPGGPSKAYESDGSLPSLAFWARAWNDAYVLNSFSNVVHWDGGALTASSLTMADTFRPRFIAGAHGNGADMWIVGDGFALKGSGL